MIVFQNRIKTFCYGDMMDFYKVKRNTLTAEISLSFINNEMLRKHE